MEKTTMNASTLISKNHTILVVDDHELIIDSTVNSLKKNFVNAEILTATNMDEGHDHLQSAKINLIVLDLSIPKSESDKYKPKPEVGIELLSEILDSDNLINIVVLSSFPEALVRLKSKIENYQNGGFTIANKTSIDDLLEKVSWSLEGITHTKNVSALRTGELRSEWFQVLELAFNESLEDRK
ncbi:MAG: response regulator, partial [Limnothrix sp.]